MKECRTFMMKTIMKDVFFYERRYETIRFGIHCPNLDRKINCPFKGIEQQCFLEKVKWIDNLSEKEKKLFWITIRFAPRINSRSDLLVNPFA